MEKKNATTNRKVKKQMEESEGMTYGVCEKNREGIEKKATKRRQKKEKQQQQRTGAVAVVSFQL